MTDIILALIALGVLVSVHETGHFIAARLCGVSVEVFSIGFGKPLFKLNRSGIEYRLGWLPLGGYVRMKGETLEAISTEAPDGFQIAKWWKKIIIAVSGPMANLLLAILIFILTFMFPSRVEDQSPVIGKVIGDYHIIFQPGDSILTVNSKPVKGWYQFAGNLSSTGQNKILLVRNKAKMTFTLPRINLENFSEEVLPSVPSVVGDVNPGMPAWQAGLKTGDRIVQIDSEQVKDWYQMRELISKPGRETVLLTVKRDNTLFKKILALEKNPLSDGQRLIGITQVMPVSYTQSYPPATAALYGVKATFNFVAINYIGLYKIISRPETIKSSVGGPVMIYSMSSQSAHKGWTSWLMFVAAISLVLMIMNLLPIPVLDGGHILFAIIQAVIGKPLPFRVQVILQNIQIAEE